MKPPILNVIKNLAVVESLFLALLIAWIYSQTSHFEFIPEWDDASYFRDNPYVINGLSLDGIGWAFTTIFAANWHPLTWISLMINVDLVGVDSGKLHLINVGWHLSNSILLLMLVRRLTGWNQAALLVALLFAIHPLHVESVAWLSEHKDLLSGFFYLLALYLYSGNIQQNRKAISLPVIIATLLALLAKPMAVTLPVTLLLLDYWPLNRLHGPREIWSSIQEKWLLWILCIITGVVTIIAQKGGNAITSVELLSLSERVAIAIQGYSGYLYRMFWPSNLGYFYPLTHLDISALIRDAVLFSFLIISMIYSIRRYPIVIFGLGWFFLTLLPVIGLIQVGGQSMADRYTYLPLIGPFILIGAIYSQLEAREGYSRFSALLFVLVMMTGLTLQAHQQTATWRNGKQLFQHAIKTIPKNHHAHYSLALIYEAEGNLVSAKNEVNKSINHLSGFANSWLLLGNIERQLRNPTAALNAYNIALEINPQATALLLNRGLLLLTEGRIPEAIDSLREARRVTPNSFKILSALGNACYSQQNMECAMESWQEAVRHEPDNPNGHYNLGFGYRRMDQLVLAHQAFAEALRLNPGFTQAQQQIERIDSGR